MSKQPNLLKWLGVAGRVAQASNSGVSIAAIESVAAVESVASVETSTVNGVLGNHIRPSDRTKIKDALEKTKKAVKNGTIRTTDPKGYAIVNVDGIHVLVVVSLSLLHVVGIITILFFSLVTIIIIYIYSGSTPWKSVTNSTPMSTIWSMQTRARSSLPAAVSTTIWMLVHTKLPRILGVSTIIQNRESFQLSSSTTPPEHRVKARSWIVWSTTSEERTSAARARRAQANQRGGTVGG